MKASVLFIGLVLTAAVVRQAQALTLAADPNTRYQQIEGWGTSLVWWDQGVRNTYETDAFRAAYRDLGLNMVRIDFAKEALQHASGNLTIPVTLGNDLQQNVDQFDFDHPYINVFGELASWLDDNALEPDRVKIVGSVWSPPHWMKGPTGNTQNFIGITPNYPTPWLSSGGNGQGTSGNSIGGRLRTEDAANLEQYGRYLAAYMKGFEQRYGVPIYAMSIQNESTFESPHNSMTLLHDANGNEAPEQYADALKAVKDAWEQFGLDTKIKGPHHSSVGPQIGNPWAVSQQMRMIDAVKSHADPELIDFLDYYGSNYYMGLDGNNPQGEDAVRALAGYYRGKDAVGGNWAQWGYAPGVINDGKPMWFSEVNGEDPAWAVNSDDLNAMGVAMNAFNALVHADATAYIYWQIYDGGNQESSGTLIGSSDLANPTAGSKKYSAYKHFTRFIRPGAVRIDAGFENGEASVGGNNIYDTAHSVNAAAFLHEQDQTLTYVLLNATGDNETVEVVLPDGYNFEDFAVYRTSATDSFRQYADLAFTEGRASIIVPRLSVVTLFGAFSLIGLPGDFDGSGQVEQGDLDLVLQNWGLDTNAAGVPNGWTNDPPQGVVDQGELDRVLQNWGSATSPDLSALSVPEPAASAVVTGFTSLFTRQRRR